jgi:hypothetical protein
MGKNIVRLVHDREITGRSGASHSSAAAVRSSLNGKIENLSRVLPNCSPLVLLGFSRDGQMLVTYCSDVLGRRCILLQIWPVKLPASLIFRGSSRPCRSISIPLHDWINNHLPEDSELEDFNHVRTHIFQSEDSALIVVAAHRYTPQCEQEWKFAVYPGHPYFGQTSGLLFAEIIDGKYQDGVFPLHIKEMSVAAGVGHTRYGVIVDTADCLRLLRICVGPREVLLHSEEEEACSRQPPPNPDWWSSSSGLVFKLLEDEECPGEHNKGAPASCVWVQSHTSIDLELLVHEIARCRGCVTLDYSISIPQLPLLNGSGLLLCLVIVTLPKEQVGTPRSPPASAPSCEEQSGSRHVLGCVISLDYFSGEFSTLHELPKATYSHGVSLSKLSRKIALSVESVYRIRETNYGFSNAALMRGESLRSISNPVLPMTIVANPTPQYSVTLSQFSHS